MKNFSAKLETMCALLNHQEKNAKTDPAAQSLKTKDPDTGSTKEVPGQRKKSGSSMAPTQAFPSPKKTEGIPSGYNVMRRRRSSKRLVNESFTVTRVIHSTVRGKHIVHCGKCLGKYYLTEQEGQMGNYSIWLQFMTHGPRRVSPVQHYRRQIFLLLEQHKPVPS